LAATRFFPECAWTSFRELVAGDGLTVCTLDLAGDGEVDSFGSVLLPDSRKFTRFSRFPTVFRTWLSNRYG
jgi:hypothetical protein